VDLEVFSDPLWGVGREDGVPFDRLDTLATYDAEIIKPSILLADRVTLRTWRVDMQVGERLQAAAMRLGAPMVGKIWGVVYGGHQGAVDRLGISTDLLRDLKHQFEMYDDKPLPRDEFFESDAVAEFVRIWLAFHRGQIEALSGTELGPLVEQGVLVEKPWDDRADPMSYPEAAWTHANQSFDYGWLSMLKELQNGSSALLLDHGIDHRLRESDLEVVQPSAITLANATDLMRMIDGLSQATIDEVIDVRAAVADHMKPFRSFILQQARGMNTSPDMPIEERRRQVALTWEADVSPAIEDLRAQIATDGFMRQMIKVASHGPEAVIGVGLGVVTAVAAGGLGVTALAGLGVAALPTIIKAAAASHEAKEGSRAAGAYLIVDVEQRLKDVHKRRGS
jgi:hypothetical protein